MSMPRDSNSRKDVIEMPKQSMVRVLRHDFKSLVNGKRHYPTLFDYVDVPRLSTYGSYAIVDLISDDQRIALATFANDLESTERARHRKSVSKFPRPTAKR